MRRFCTAGWRDAPRDEAAALRRARRTLAFVEQAFLLGDADRATLEWARARVKAPEGADGVAQ